jgi:hypothetical protein
MFKPKFTLEEMKGIRRKLVEYYYVWCLDELTPAAARQCLEIEAERIGAGHLASAFVNDIIRPEWER